VQDNQAKEDQAQASEKRAMASAAVAEKDELIDQLATDKQALQVQLARTALLTDSSSYIGP
jgi:hypothetical protein